MSIERVQKIQALLNELDFHEFCQVVAVMGAQLPGGELKMIVPMPDGKQAIVFSRTAERTEITRLMNAIDGRTKGGSYIIE